MTVPLPITLAVLAAAVILVVGIPAALAGSSEGGARMRRRTALATGLTLSALLGATILLIPTFDQGPTAPPGAVYLLVGVPVAGLIAARTITPLRRLLDDRRTQSRLVRLHAWRVVGGVFLIMAGLGGLPWLFALPAGLGDIAVSFTAPTVARWVRDGARRRATLTWTALGLLDFVVAVGLGATSAPGIVQVFHTTPSAELLTTMPLVLIPAFLVPVWILLHVISLRFLLHRRTPAPVVQADVG